MSCKHRYSRSHYYSFNLVKRWDNIFFEMRSIHDIHVPFRDWSMISIWTLETLYYIVIQRVLVCYLTSFIYRLARNFHPFSSSNPHFLREFCAFGWGIDNNSITCRSRAIIQCVNGLILKKMIFNGFGRNKT